MTNEEVIKNLEKIDDVLDETCYGEKTRAIAHNSITLAINLIQENTKLKAEIERIKEDYSVLARQYNNVENSSIRYYNEVKQLKAELEKLDKYNSKLCIELTITMDKLCLAEKEIEWLEKER